MTKTRGSSVRTGRHDPSRRRIGGHHREDANTLTLIRVHRSSLQPGTLVPDPSIPSFERQGASRMSFHRLRLAKTTSMPLFGVVLVLVLLLGGTGLAFAQDAATPAARPAPTTADNSQPAPPSIGAD